MKLGAVVCAACVVFAGCSRSGLTEISGVVSYAGEPVQNGTINLFPADDNGPTAAGIITDGRYSLKTAIGKKKVRIEAFTTVGRRHYKDNPSLPMIDVREQFLPKRYNANSELTCEITSGTDAYDFPLAK